MVWEGVISGSARAVAGAIVGSVLTQLKEKLDYERKIASDLAVARAQAHDRLLRIEEVSKRGDQKLLDDEFWHLGSDIDRHLVALASIRTRERQEREWDVHEQLSRLLVSHDLATLPRLATVLRSGEV